MADLGILDILALSKAGYKKKDIDAIIAGEAEKPAEPKTPEADQGGAPDPDNNPEDLKKEGEAEKPAQPEPENIDYKSLYEKLQKETEENKKTIRELQTKINSQDRSGTGTETNPAADLLNSFKNFS